jgi:hypothetical protein
MFSPYRVVCPSISRDSFLAWKNGRALRGNNRRAKAGTVRRIRKKAVRCAHCGAVCQYPLSGKKDNRLLLLSFSRIAPRRLYKGLQRDGSLEKAGDGTRTRDSLLGRQELYQLSYSRAKTTAIGVTVTGRGARTRTADLLVPNQARYQLRYTPLHPMRRFDTPGSRAL